jgi:hypothetical protein
LYKAGENRLGTDESVFYKTKKKTLMWA